MRYFTIAMLALVLTATGVSAQTGDGSLRGYVRDESGAVLPGVAFTATSEALISPKTPRSRAAASPLLPSPAFPY